MEQSNELDTGVKLSSTAPAPTYIELAFKWNNNPREYKTEVTPEEYAQIMNRGMVDGKPISEVSVWYDGSSELIYSFQAAGAGNSAWKIKRY